MDHSEKKEMFKWNTPKWTLRWWMAMLTVIVVALLTAGWFTPWPDTLVVHGTLEVTGIPNEWYFRTYVEASNLKQLRPGMEAHITLDVKDRSWGYYTAKLQPLPQHSDSTGLYPIELCVGDYHTSKGGFELELWSLDRREDPWLMDATATIILRERHLLPRVLGIE